MTTPRRFALLMTWAVLSQVTITFGASPEPAASLREGIRASIESLNLHVELDDAAREVGDMDLALRWKDDRGRLVHTIVYALPSPGEADERLQHEIRSVSVSPSGSPGIGDVSVSWSSDRNCTVMARTDRAVIHVTGAKPVSCEDIASRVVAATREWLEADRGTTAR